MPAGRSISSTLCTLQDPHLTHVRMLVVSDIHNALERVHQLTDWMVAEKQRCEGEARDDAVERRNEREEERERKRESKGRR